MASFSIAFNSVQSVWTEIFTGSCEHCMGAGIVICPRCAGTKTLRRRPANFSHTRLEVVDKEELKCVSGLPWRGSQNLLKAAREWLGCIRLKSLPGAHDAPAGGGPAHRRQARLLPMPCSMSALLMANNKPLALDSGWVAPLPACNLGAHAPSEPTTEN